MCSDGWLGVGLDILALLSPTCEESVGLAGATPAGLPSSCGTVSHERVTERRCRCLEGNFSQVCRVFFLISGGGNEDAKKGRFGPSADT